jgi:hypothetical protein
VNKYSMISSSVMVFHFLECHSNVIILNMPALLGAINSFDQMEDHAFRYIETRERFHVDLLLKGPI